MVTSISSIEGDTMRGKTIHIYHSPKSSYLIYSIFLVMGIVAERWDVMTIVTLALVFNSLLDLVEIRDTLTPSADEESYKIIGRFGDRSLFTSNGQAKGDDLWMIQHDDKIH